MRAIDASRLTYLHETLSYRDIAERTNIPISTISYVVRGERELSPRYREQLRDTYRQQVYIDYRGLGVSETSATRYTLTSPERARSVLTHAEEMKNTYIQKSLLSKIAYYEKNDIPYSMPDLYKKSVDEVTKALEYTEEDPKDWTEEGYKGKR